MSFRKYLQESLQHGQEISHSHPGMKHIKYIIQQHETGAFDIVDDDDNIVTTISATTPEQAREIAKKEGYDV